VERWSAFPTWWVRKGLLKQLGAGAMTTGGHIAALKVYLAIAIASDYSTRITEISLTQLQVVTGCSRPMVAAAIRVLETLAVISVDRSGYRSRYSLLQAEGERHWMKLPIAALRSNIKHLPNSTAAGLAALKLLLVLFTVRQRGSHESPISHKKLQAYTGVRPSIISRGISLLVAHGLVRFANTARFTDAAGHPVNTYYLLGTFAEGVDTDEDKQAGAAPEPDGVSDEESPELAV
jgi:hypothetical protein